MMLALILESALRCAALCAAVWLLLKAIRLRDLQLEQQIWVLVILFSLAMPMLMPNIAIPLPARAIPAQVASTVLGLAVVQSRALGIETVLWDLYLLITLVLLARFASGLWLAARIRRTARPLSLSWAGSLDVRVTSRVPSPSCFGTTILLPVEWESWDSRKLRAVIAHESAHISQRDYYGYWLASLNCAVFWFNPCAFWLRRRVNVLTELLSDEVASAALGDRVGYAEVLVALAAAPQPLRATIAMGAPATLIPRLKRLLENDMSAMKFGRTGKLVVMSTVMALAASTSFCATGPLVLSHSQDAKVSFVSGQPLGDFYPKALAKSGVEGLVTCRLTIDATGQVIDAVAVREKPANSGLALAAVEAAKTFRFNNTLSRPVVKMLAVKFELKGPKPKDQSAASSQ
jgi:beta-lactamase regulating signal transducer with metallopeptidase domain